MITGLSHVSIVVPDLEAAVERLACVYGLQAGPVATNEEQGVRLAYVELPNAKIEIMQPTRSDTPAGRFLARSPAGGIHHFCLGVEDVQAASAAWGAKGARVIGADKPQRNVHGGRIAFVHPKDFLGALVELEQPAR